MEKLKIGIVGLNFGREIIARELITGPAQPYFELAAVCDLVVGKADQAAKQYCVKAYYDIDSLLTDPNIPVIGLYAGPVGRATLVRRIIRAGKEVMTTKPFETDPDAALDVLIEARRLGRVVHLNSPSPLFTDDLQQIQDWRNEYNLGRPIACRADTWGSYREKPDGSWYDDPDQCPVAPIFRIGIYTINDIVCRTMRRASLRQNGSGITASCRRGAMRIGVGLYRVNGHQIQHDLEGHPDAELVATAAFHQAWLTDAQQGDRTIRHYETLGELPQDDRVQLVSLWSPRRRDQAEESIRCLEAGKHVYAEKPCAMTEEDLDATRGAVERTGMQFHEMAGTAF